MKNKPGIRQVNDVMQERRNISASERMAPRRSFELRVTSDPANLAPARKAAEAFCLECGLGEPAAGDVGLCLNEAMANVTRHAYGGATGKPVLIRGDLEPQGVRITVRDWGNGINPADRPAKAHDPNCPGGLGLICLHRMLDEAFYTPQPDGMLLTMVKKMG